MEIKTLKEPTYNAHGGIDCIVEFTNIKGKHPHTVTPGSEVEQQLIDGGNILPYTAPEPTWGDVRYEQKRLLSYDSDVSWRLERYNSQEALTDKAPKESKAKIQAMLQYCQDVRDCDEGSYSTPQEALAALGILKEPAE